MTIARFSSLVLILTLLTGPVGNDLFASGPDPLDADSLSSSCRVARGFSAGAMMGATVAGLTPGGQTAALILVMTVLSMEIGISIVC